MSNLRPKYLRPKVSVGKSEALKWVQEISGWKLLSEWSEDSLWILHISS